MQETKIEIKKYLIIFFLSFHLNKMEKIKENKIKGVKFTIVGGSVLIKPYF
jgi:hypothetical protein